MWMSSNYFVLIIFFSSSAAWPFSSQNEKFTNYSYKMNVELTGFMSAYADFNADRTMDIFVLDKIKGEQVLDVILMAKDSQITYERKHLLKDRTNGILGVVAGDFNGDSILDLIIQRGTAGSFTVDVAYGMTNRSGLMPAIPIAPGITFLTPPLHLDWNADMTGDLLGQMTNKTWIVMLGGNRTFRFISPAFDVPNMDDVMYSKFVDLDRDGQSDILLVGRSNGYVALTSILKSNGLFSIGEKYVSKIKVAKLGQGVIGDFKIPGELSMIVPICTDDTCANSQLLMCTFPYIQCDDISLSFDGDNMQFVPGKKNNKLSLIIPEIVPMSCGDLHLTGQIECLVIVAEKNDVSKTRVMLLINNGNMNFSIKPLEGSADLYTNVSQVAVFDLEEDGIPDIVIARQHRESGLITPLLHESSNDQYFIKVLVLNGLCSNPDNCPNNRLPYGIPLPGISVSYSTESFDGGIQSAITSLCDDSAYTSLQLPYAHFGLGSFANYVERLFVKLPSNNISRQHTLTFIVPKTQLAIIPYPLDDPSQWTNKLFLEPFRNRKVIYVAAALLGTFLLVTIIACILQYLEVRVDRLEKMQEAQKFHFDAM